MTSKLLIFLLIASPVFLKAQDTVHISLKNGDTSEQNAKEQLQKILQAYDLKKWLFTKEVLIDKNAIPFSHPVLTLNTRYVNDDLTQLATFLHEEFHWFEEIHQQNFNAAIEDFKLTFPKTPDRNNGGARDEYSNYLHLVVCDLEFQALTTLLGKPKAREILQQWNYYTWIYDKVLNDPIVRQTMIKHGLLVP